MKKNLENYFLHFVHASLYLDKVVIDRWVDEAQMVEISLDKGVPIINFYYHTWRTRVTYRVVISRQKRSLQYKLGIDSTRSKSSSLLACINYPSQRTNRGNVIDNARSSVASHSSGSSAILGPRWSRCLRTRPITEHLIRRDAVGGQTGGWRE